MAKKKSVPVEAIKHKRAKRKNIPTAELESVMEEDIKKPIQIAYERRNEDLDPQIVWRGKEQQDETPFNVSAPPLYIQEKVQPKAIIEGLRRETKARVEKVEPATIDMFNDFNGLPDIGTVTAFYQHDQNWSNRMICGDSMSVMASLSEREGLRGKVQCIYIDPPYGIRFNSNFQWSTTSTNVKDGAKEHFTREPEQVKAFRDTWADGIHTYLGYLRDRLVVAKDLLSEKGSIFVQIGDENIHRVRMLMDEIFGDDNFVSLINFRKTLPLGSSGLANIGDYIIWYACNKDSIKRKELFDDKLVGAGTSYTWLKFPDTTERTMTAEEKQRPDSISANVKTFFPSALASSGYTPTCTFDFDFEGCLYKAGKKSWRTNREGLNRLIKSDRIFIPGNLPRYKAFHQDFPVQRIHNFWNDTSGATDMQYVVQTSNKVVERCILMTTDPGDLVLDPTCGSGTTAYVAEQWGRRWITIDTSRVALALARSRLMGARYPYYILEDTPQGQEKKAEITQTPRKTSTTNADIRHGFVYERVPHITLKSIANNTEIDVIWEQVQPNIDKALNELNNALKRSKQTFQVESGARANQIIDFSKNGNDKLPSGENVPHGKLLEWEVPRTAPKNWSKLAKTALEKFWEARIRRQNDIDKSTNAKADFECLYDKPFVDKSKIRVVGPFTVESLSPHRSLVTDQNDEIIDEMKIASNDPDIAKTREPAATEFVSMVLDELNRVGVHQVNREDRINFTSIIGEKKGGGGGGVIFLVKRNLLREEKQKRLPSL